MVGLIASFEFHLLVLHYFYCSLTLSILGSVIRNVAPPFDMG